MNKDILVTSYYVASLVGVSFFQFLLCYKVSFFTEKQLFHTQIRYSFNEKECNDP